MESPLDVEEEKLVAAADEALVEFHHGAASNRCDWVMSSEDGPLANTAHRGAIKELVAVAEIRSRLRFRDGDIPGAIDDAVAAMPAARHLSVDGSLASVLFAYRIENSVTGIVARNLLRLSTAQLRELESAISGLPNGSDLKIAFEGEKLDRNDILASVQAATTRDELIEGLLRNIPVLKSNRELAEQIVDGCGGSVRGFTHVWTNNSPFMYRGLPVSPSHQRNSKKRTRWNLIASRTRIRWSGSLLLLCRAFVGRGI